MIRKDYDGLFTLSLSTTLILFSFGSTYLLTFVHILLTAIKAGCDNKKSQNIVILGKKLNNNLPDSDYRQRLDRALSIISKATSNKVHIFGGITGDASISEARAGQNYLEENGIKTNDIYLEEKSRDTLENMRQLKKYTAKQNEYIILITNRYHLARACIMAQGYGFIVEKCAAEDRYKPGYLATLSLFIESFYLHWYLTGRTYARLTHNKRMLSRIQ